MNKVIFLGTSAGMPTIERNLAAIALVFNSAREFWLFDCGEGTQRQILQTELKLSKLTNIFISHLHGDHIFGLPGLLATRGLQGNKKPINIFGPAGLDNYLENCLHYSSTYIPYPYHYHLIEKNKYSIPEKLMENGDLSVQCAILNHKIDSFGFAITQQSCKKNISVEKLINLGIQPGPIYKKFKENKIVHLKDGRILETKNFLKESVSSKKICYCGDTAFSQNAVDLSEKADLLIHEATFCAGDEEKAARAYHSTVGDAIKIARLGRVKKLALTHFSPRYNEVSECNNESTKNVVELSINEPEIILAKDFLAISL